LVGGRILRYSFILGYYSFILFHYCEKNPRKHESGKEFNKRGEGGKAIN